MFGRSASVSRSLNMPKLSFHQTVEGKVGVSPGEVANLFCEDGVQEGVWLLCIASYSFLFVVRVNSGWLGMGKVAEGEGTDV